MKVLMLSSYHAKGGAARAASRLASALPAAGVTVDYRSIYARHMTPVQKLAYYWRVAHDRLPAYWRARRRIMFSAGSLGNADLVRQINASDADLVHLHWINGGALAVEDLNRINKPMVWTLHDMWAFTGGCHYDAGCGRFTQGCGACPQLNSEHAQDLSYRSATAKAVTYRRATNLTIIAVSRWMAEGARQSRAMSGLPIVTLPNLIDTQQFRPADRQQARTHLGLPASGKIIVFGADAAVVDPRKGYQHMLAALALLPVVMRENIELAVFGSASVGPALEHGFRVHHYGRVGDEQLNHLYNAADVMVVPSIQEAFGQTALEAMACATPVVAFATTGLLDIVDHQRNGFLARAFEPASLAEGICWVLEHNDPPTLRRAARQKVLDCFNSCAVALRYRQLYERCLDLKPSEEPGALSVRTHSA